MISSCCLHAGAWRVNHRGVVDRASGCALEHSVKPPWDELLIYINRTEGVKHLSFFLFPNKQCVIATTICAVDTFKYRTMQIWNAFISSFSNLIGHETNLTVSLPPADSSWEHTPVVSQSSTEERERPGGGCDHQVSVLSCVSSVKSLKYIELCVSDLKAQGHNAHLRVWILVWHCESAVMRGWCDISFPPQYMVIEHGDRQAEFCEKSRKL